MSNIRVALRVRPLNEKEKNDGSQEIVKVNGNSVRIENVKVLGIPEFGDSRARIREFVFDHCYNCMHGDSVLSTQAKVFEDLGTEVLKAAFDGFNACVFAYGQTGTGKTHTMMGYPGDVGLIPRVCEGLFSHMSDCTDENVTSRIDISYFEIYNERVRDLLQPELLKMNENYSLKVREHPKEGPYVKDLSWHRVKDNEDMLALLDKGNEYRVTAETYMHGHSSRSHAIVTVCYTQARLEENRPSEIVSKINLVDLAGSERADPSSKPDFRKRLTEGANINKSLVTLGYVIKALAERSLLSWASEEMGSTQSFQSSGGGETLAGSSPSGPTKQRVPYIPYRDSVLTWLLKDSLGGNSKTIMIATITPASQYYSESISTLRYAQRAKNIINKPRINEDGNVALIRELRREIERLHEMLASAQIPATQLGANYLPGDIVYFVPSLHRGPDGSDDQGGNLITLPESEDSIIAEKLHENEEMDSDLSIRGLRNRSSSMGVMIDSQLPYLVGMDDDVLSTGIVIFHLKEGDTLVGGEDADIAQDIVLHGPTIEKDHCVIRHLNGEVYLHPCPGAMCTVQGLECTEPTKLTQGDYVVLGGNQVFRFNNPSEAAKLRENRRSQGSLNMLNSSHLSFGGLSRASSYSSIGGEDSNYLSPHSQLGRSYPNSSRRHSDIIIYAASDMCRDLEKRYKTEQERIEETKRELEKLKVEHEKMEELRQLKEEEMYQMHEQHRADIEEQKCLLARQIEENERARAMAEDELHLARESLSKEKQAFQKQLEEERRNLKMLQKLEQQQETMAIQTDPLSTQTTSVGSDPLSTQTASVGSKSSSTNETSTSADENDVANLPVKYKGGRRLSAHDQLEELAQTEFTRRMSYRETEESLDIQQEDIEDAYIQTQEQIQERLLKIQKIEEEYKEMDKAHLQEIAAHTEKVHEIRKQEVQLEVYIQENEELMNVGREKPRPLRSACSEMFLLDPSIEDQEYSQKTTSLLDIQGEANEEQEQFSPRSRSLRRSSSAESLESGIGENSKDQNMEDDKKESQKARKISSVAKEVTSRLYRAPEPKFRYVPKVKEKEIKTVPRTKTFRNSYVSSRTSPVKAVRDFDRSKSESPQRGTGKRTSLSPATDVDPKKRSASAPQRDPKVKGEPKPTNGKADKQDKNESKVIAVRNKTQGPNRTTSPTSRLGGAVSPERLGVVGPNILRTSTPNLRHMVSASSLASVPESLAEHEDLGVHENQIEQNIGSYVVKKRQKKGRANFIDDDFRCHSAPDSQRMSLAFDDYTDQMSLDHQPSNSTSDRIVPLVTTSVSVDDSVMFREEESNITDNIYIDYDESGRFELNSETQRNEKDIEKTDHEIKTKESASLNEPSVHMYISSGEESKCVDDMEVSEESSYYTDTVKAENKADSDRSEENSTTEPSEEVIVIDDSIGTCIPLETESIDPVVLGKREIKDRETLKDTDVPTKKPKSEIGISDDAESISDPRNSESEPEIDQNVKSVKSETENFSEDSLDLNISVDSLEGEKHFKKLSQSLPAYLIRSQKPMSDDSLSDSFDEQNKDSLDSEQSDKGKDTVLKIRNKHTQEVIQNLKESNLASLAISDFQSHENTESPSVFKGPNLTKVSQEPIAFLPADSSGNTESAQLQVIDAIAVTPEDEESTNSVLHNGFEGPVSQSESGIVAGHASEAENLTKNKNVTVEHETAAVNQFHCDNKAVSDGSLINDSKNTLKQNHIETDNDKFDRILQLRYREDMSKTNSKGEAGDKKTAYTFDIKTFVSDVIHHAQELCRESSKCESGIGIQDEQHFKTFEQMNGRRGETAIDIVKTQDDLKLSIDRNEAGDEDNLNKSEVNIGVTPDSDEGMNVVVANICDEMLQDHSVVSSFPSQKDNEVNRENEQKSMNVVTDADTALQVNLKNETLDDLNVISGNIDSEIDRNEREGTKSLTAEKQKNDFANDVQRKDKGPVDKGSKKHDPVVDENHNVVETEVEEPEADHGHEPVTPSSLETTVNKIKETVPVSQTDEQEIKTITENNMLKNENPPIKKEHKLSPSNPYEEEKINENSSEKSAEDNVFESDKRCIYKSSGSEEPAQHRADIANDSSPLKATRTVGVGTSQELLDNLDDVIMGDNLSQGSDDSFLLDPREKLQVYQEALAKLTAKPTTGPQLSTSRRAARQRAMIRQQHRGADSDGVVQLSDEAPVSGTQTKISSRPGSGSRRRKRPAKTTDKSAKCIHNHSSDDYGSSENDSVYSDDSIDAQGNLSGAKNHEEHLFSNGVNEDLVFYERGEKADMLSRPKQKHHTQLSPSQRQDLTEVVDGPDGRRTVGIQTCNHSLRYRSTGSARTDVSDFDGSFASEGRGMVMSPLSLWNSNERSGSESQSDQNSTSSAGFVKHLNDLERSVAATPRSSLRSNTSLFSDRSNLEKGPTEVWSSSSSELRPLQSFRDDLSYVIETEGMSPGASAIDYTEDTQGQHSSIYMRTPQEGECLIPRPECSTPTHSGRVVNISFPESQLQQAAKLDDDTPVQFQVTVHEDNTNIEYNVEKTEYKTYALRSQNEPNIIPDRILVNVTENVNSQIQENFSTQHQEEITIHQPDIVRSPEDSVVLEKSYRLSSSSEREMETENDIVIKDESKEEKDEIDEKSYCRIPSGSTIKELVVKKKEIKLQHSGVVEATSYPSTTEVAESGDEPSESGMTCEEVAEASLGESDYTSDYGTITSIDGRRGYMSFTSDSEDSESFAISPRSPHVTESELGETANQSDKQQTEYLPLQNEIIDVCQNTIMIPEEGQTICSTAHINGSITVAGTQEKSADISPQIIKSSGDETHHTEGVEVGIEHEGHVGLASDLGYGSMKPDTCEDKEEREDQIEEEMETDSSSFDTVRQVKAGQNQNFCLQETLDDLTSLTVSHEIVEMDATDTLPQPEVNVPKLDLTSSPLSSPQRQQKLSCSSTDDTYMSLDQSESNTSTCSSDYRTPQQSPRELDQNILSQEVDDVVIPDYCDEISQSTPRQKADEFSPDQAPIVTSSPKQLYDVRTVSVNTESLPSATLSAPPATSRIRHIFGTSKDPVHTEVFRKDLEKKIAKLQRHVRSLSDSAISSDFTDGDSSSVSPRGSRVYDEKAFLEERRLSKALRTTQSPIRVRQVLSFEGPPSKLPFKDSGNVFDDDNNGDGVERSKETQMESVPLQSYFLPVASAIGTFPERLVDALLAIKPQPLQRCHSLDSLSAIINLKPYLSRAVREFQSIEDMPGTSSQTKGAADNVSHGGNTLMSSDGARPLSPGEIGMDQESLDGIYAEIEKENIVPEVNLPIKSSQNTKISEKSTSMSFLGDNLPDREYRRSLSEGNIDGFDADNDNLDSSNDSITFVFIKDERTKPTREIGQDNSDLLNGVECYDPCGSGEMYESESQSPDSRQMSSPGEYSDRDQQGEVVNISGRGHQSPESEDRVSDVLSLSDSKESVIEYDQDNDEAGEVSTHTASEEIEEIICQNENLEQIHGSRDIAISCQTDSPPTFTDTSDSFVQNKGKHYDDDSEPLRHKFGIDESVLPLPERSMSADNIPRHLLPLEEIMRSRSTGMLDVGVANEQESESGIFPPALKTDDDTTEQSVSLNTMSEGGLDHMSQRTFSDIEASLSNQTSGNVDSDNSYSEENSSAIVRSICSKSSSVESLEEEFVIDFKTNWKKPPKRHTVHDSGSSEGEIDPEVLENEQQQIRRVLETVQRLIMPKPTTVDRGMTTDNEAGSNCVSIGVQAPSSPTNIQQSENIQAVLRPDQIILPALAAPFRAQSMDSFGLGANSQGLELSEESRNWCTLGELMVETTHLLRRINDRLPEQDRKGSVSSSEESQASQVILKRWQEISIQTGRSIENLTSIGSQTDGNYELIETAVEKNQMFAESTQDDQGLKLKPLHLSDTVTHDILPFTACEMYVQTDETADMLSEEVKDKYEYHCIDNMQESMSAQAVAQVSLSQYEHQSSKKEQTDILLMPSQNKKMYQMPVKNTAKFIPQVKVELGLDQMKNNESDGVSKSYSPRGQQTTSRGSLQSPGILLPGFTLPDTPEIVALRKEHEKLMENLRKASDDRNNRKEKLQLRKKTAHSENSLGESFREDSLMKAETEFHVKKDENESLLNARSRSKSKDSRPNKNDPETESSSSESNNPEDIVRSDGEDRGPLSDKEVDEDAVRSDSDDREPSLEEYTQDVIRSDGEDEAFTSENKKMFDDEDDKPKHASYYNEGSKSPLSTQEFVQISIQVDPNTGVTVENKTYREQSPVRKPGQNKDKNSNTKAIVHMKEQHTWAIAGDEFKTVWERRPESRSRTESNTSQDTIGPSESPAVMPGEDKSMKPAAETKAGDVHPSYADEKDVINEIIDDVLEDYPIRPMEKGAMKPVQQTFADNDLKRSRNESEESLNSVVEDIVVPQSNSRDQSVPQLLKRRSSKDRAPQENRNDRKVNVCPSTSQDTVCLEETIVPQICKREHNIPPSLLHDSVESPFEVEPKSVTEEDPRERGPKLSQQIIKCETSPKYKAQILREQHRLASSPDFTDSKKVGPEDKVNNEENIERTALKSAVLPEVLSEDEIKPYCQIHTFSPLQDEADSTEQISPPIGPKKDKPDHVNSFPYNKRELQPPRFADDATQMSVEFSDDYTQTDADSPIENVISPNVETKTNSLPKTLIPGDAKDPTNNGVKEHKGNSEESTDMQTSNDMKEELENLQHERQHIMDLLGLSYLPNSLTVELLEAKLNHCIGQTDLLLENLEISIDPEESKKPTTEQKQAKDYISKYRADLKKSKEDIKECREQLNKGRGRGRSSGRGRTPFRRRDIYNQQRQAEIDAFKLERMREQQDYQRSGHAYSSRHATPSKCNTPLKGNTPLMGNTPLYGNSPMATPRSDRSRSSSPSYSPSYMNPKEHKAHLVDLRRQLIKDVVEEEKQYSRSCSPSFHTSPPPVLPKHRSPSEQSLGFSPKVSVSLLDNQGSPSSSSPSSSGSKTYIVAPGTSSLSPVRRPASYDPTFQQPGNPYGSYQNSPDRAGVGRRTSPGALDRKMMAESIFSPQESEQILHEIEEIKKRTPSISAPMEELLRRSSFSSTSSQRSSSSRPDKPNLSPRSHSDPRLLGRHNTSPLARQLNNPLSLNLDCLQDDETGPYSPYSAYAREHIMPSERSPPGGVLRGTYELYNDRSDTSSVLSYDSDTFSDPGHRPRHDTLDEDTIKRLRPIRAEDIKARINRYKR